MSVRRVWARHPGRGKRLHLVDASKVSAGVSYTRGRCGQNGHAWRAVPEVSDDEKCRTCDRLARGEDAR